MATRGVLIVVCVLAVCSVSVHSSPQNGMRVEAFRGIPHMVLVECSASPIEPDADLYSMSIFRLHHGVPVGPVASLRPWKDECLTSSSFSSCHVDQRNVRHTKLRTIVSVAGLGEHERRAFGCNVTYSRRDGAMRKLSWSITVEPICGRK